MNAIGHDNGNIREQRVGLLDSGQIPRSPAADLKIVLQIEEGIELFAECRIVTNQEYTDHEASIELGCRISRSSSVGTRSGFHAIWLMAYVVRPLLPGGRLRGEAVVGLIGLLQETRNSRKYIRINTLSIMI
jgi:hypothetical protein